MPISPSNEPRQSSRDFEDYESLVNEFYIQIAKENWIAAKVVNDAINKVLTVKFLINELPDFDSDLPQNIELMINRLRNIIFCQEQNIYLLEKIEGSRNNKDAHIAIIESYAELMKMTDLTCQESFLAASYCQELAFMYSNPKLGIPYFNLDEQLQELQTGLHFLYNPPRSVNNVLIALQINLKMYSIYLYLENVDLVFLKKTITDLKSLISNLISPINGHEIIATVIEYQTTGLALQNAKCLSEAKAIFEEAREFLIASQFCITNETFSKHLTKLDESLKMIKSIAPSALGIFKQTIGTTKNTQIPTFERVIFG